MSIIVAAYRTAIVPRGGAFAALDLHELATPVVRALLQKSGFAPERIGEVIVSNALGEGGNPARRIALAADLPETVAGLSLDRQCVGGLDALLLADAMIRAGQHDVIIAGGVESYSRRPLRFHTFTDGRAPEPYDQAPFTPWPDRDPEMSAAAETLSQRLGIDRDAQDSFAIASHQKAFEQSFEEIVPLEGVTRDPFARALTREHTRRAKRIIGTITSANTAVAADAAAFCLVVSDELAEEQGLRGLRLVDGLTLGGEPDLPGQAPVKAVETLLARQSLSTRDIDRAEIMEAFAVQALACIEGTGLDPRLVNIRGGALSRGHPIGASGAVLAVRLFHDLKEGELGLAAIAAAGGLGTAVLFKA